jgi:hypothetical protein
MLDTLTPRQKVRAMAQFLSPGDPYKERLQKFLEAPPAETNWPFEATEEDCVFIDLIIDRIRYEGFGLSLAYLSYMTATGRPVGFIIQKVVDRLTGREEFRPPMFHPPHGLMS